MPSPSFSVIIPVKRSQATIRACVDALLGQDYPGAVEIIVVGDADDPSFAPLHDLIIARRIRAIETTPPPGVILRRDANWKRAVGLRAATGHYLALTDSDMVMPPDWLTTAAALLETHPVVAGTMRTQDDSFWGRYTDHAAIAKTPRFAGDYTIAAANFGARKTPVTANLALRRGVYVVTGGPDPAFQWSYEDIEWCWRIAAEGYPIYCTDALWGWHHHRQGWRALLKEYCNSGKGCADFARRYPASPFSRRRTRQAAALLGGGYLALLLCMALLGAGLTPPWLPIAALAALGYLALAALNLRAARRPDALLYPAVTLAFVAAFLYGLLCGLLEWEAHGRVFGRVARRLVRRALLNLTPL